jgi:hypothetical protein
LDKIVLGKNKIGNEGLMAMAVNGNKFERLLELFLNDNQIGDEGFKAMAENGNKFKCLK